MIKVYEYPNCTTCKRARIFLKNNNVDAKFVHIVEQVPTKEELKKALGKKDLKKIFNTSGKSYRDSDLKDRFNELTLETALDLLVSDGMLIKRPILIDEKNDIYLVGFKEDEWERIL